MSHSVEKLTSNKVKISFQIPAEQFGEAVQKAYLKMRGRINVPGFRKGHAPRKLIENMYGEGVFYDEAFELLFPDVYEAAVEGENLQVVDRPEVDVQQIGVGKELCFTAEVFVRPDVTLGEYKGLAVEKHLHPVTDEDVKSRIDQDVERTSSTQDVDDRPVQEGDIVNLDYAGTVDGQAFAGGTAQGQTLTIGSGMFIPGFEEQMVGMAIGEEKDLSVTFPGEYHSEELAGKDAIFHVKVNGIQQKVKPELDDDFAADVSEFDTYAQYEADIRRQLTEQAEKQADIACENELVQKAVDAAQCDIPEAMINDQIEEMIREMKLRMAYQGLRYEDYLKYTNQTEDNVRDMYRVEAGNRVKTELVLEAIRKAEGIEPTDEEVDQAVADQAQRVGKDAAEYKTTLSEKQLSYLRDTAAIQKVLDFLKENAVITLCEAHEEPAQGEPAQAEAAQPQAE